MNKLEKLCLVIIAIALVGQSFINFKIRDEVKANEKKLEEYEERIKTLEQQTMILEYKYWDLYYLGISSYNGEYEYYE